MKKHLLLFALLTAAAAAAAQSYAFGLKGGLTVGSQRWSDFERDPSYKMHGIAFIESADEENNFSIFAQGGYHIKGSAMRNRTFQNPINGDLFRPPAYEFLFRNISVTVGGKQKFPFTGAGKLYYMLGVRGDYTLSTNLAQYNDFNEQNPAYAIFPFDDREFIREFNYGLTLGGGMELPFTELVGMILELTVNPDFSLQYQQPAIPNVTDPFTGTQRTLPERKVRNLTLELTLGFRFLHKIEYID